MPPLSVDSRQSRGLPLCFYPRFDAKTSSRRRSAARCPLTRNLPTPSSMTIPTMKKMTTVMDKTTMLMVNKMRMMMGWKRCRRRRCGRHPRAPPRGKSSGPKILTQNETNCHGIPANLTEKWAFSDQHCHAERGAVLRRGAGGGCRGGSRGRGGGGGAGAVAHAARAPPSLTEPPNTPRRICANDVNK